jgi:hypothetical protein
MYWDEERLKNWAATPDIIGAIHLDAALYGVPEKEMTRLKIVGLSRSLNAAHSKLVKAHLKIRKLEKENALLQKELEKEKA